MGVTKPTSVIDWANSAAAGDSVFPATGLEASGYPENAPLPHDEFNGILERISGWIVWLNQTFDIDGGAFFGSGGLLDVTAEDSSEVVLEWTNRLPGLNAILKTDAFEATVAALDTVLPTAGAGANWVQTALSLAREITTDSTATVEETLVNRGGGEAIQAADHFRVLESLTDATITGTPDQLHVGNVIKACGVVEFTVDSASNVITVDSSTGYNIASVAGTPLGLLQINIDDNSTVDPGIPIAVCQRTSALSPVIAVPAGSSLSSTLDFQIYQENGGTLTDVTTLAGDPSYIFYFILI